MKRRKNGECGFDQAGGTRGGSEYNRRGEEEGG